jgi:eukaryotic-like serine/threonine-protein kinase
VDRRELTRVGKYEILGLLGEGGMARVYRARMQGLARATKNVALKLIHSRLVSDRDFVLMFLDEMSLAMALEHRNIVQTFDAGRWAARPAAATRGQWISCGADRGRG